MSWVEALKTAVARSGTFIHSFRSSEELPEWFCPYCDRIFKFLNNAELKTCPVCKGHVYYRG